jgi:hypothetical protein
MKPLKNHKKSISRAPFQGVKGQSKLGPKTSRYSLEAEGTQNSPEFSSLSLAPALVFKSHEFRTNEAAQALLNAVFDETSKSGVSVLVSDLPYGHSGVFDPKNGVISLAAGLSDEESLGVLVHEFCHFRQWRDGSSLYQACQSWGDSIGPSTAGVGAKAFIDHMVANGYNQTEMIYEGKDLLLSSASAAVAMEAEAEEMTISLLKSAGVSKEILDRYAKTANAYLAWHYLAIKGGQSADLVKFYHLNEKILPTTVNSQEFTNLPEYPKSIAIALKFWNQCGGRSAYLSSAASNTGLKNE